MHLSIMDQEQPIGEGPEPQKRVHIPFKGLGVTPLISLTPLYPNAPMVPETSIKGQEMTQV